MSNTLLQGEIERLEAAASGAVSTGRVPIVQNDQLVTVTVNEIATGARAVDGPASSTDNAIPRFDGTTGLAIQDSGCTIDDSDNLDVAGTITQTTGKADYEKFVGIDEIIALSAGTWTITRVAQGDYVYRKTAGDDTTIIGIDITEAYRTTASKGFSLTSLDYIFRNTTADLDAHTATLDLVNYTDSETVTVTSVTLSGSLAVGQDADPQIDTLTVSTPAFETTAASKYVLEVTVNAAGTSVYDFIGVVLNFTRNDL